MNPLNIELQKEQFDVQNSFFLKGQQGKYSCALPNNPIQNDNGKTFPVKTMTSKCGIHSVEKA